MASTGLSSGEGEEMATLCAEVPGGEANTIVNNDGCAVTAPPAGC